jgi:uncharacterized Zn-finger protein
MLSTVRGQSRWSYKPEKGKLGTGYMKITEEIKVGTLNVACDGGKGHLGHPTVYLNLEEKGEVVCPYCSKKYIFDKSMAEHAAH